MSECWQEATNEGMYETYLDECEYEEQRKVMPGLCLKRGTQTGRCFRKPGHPGWCGGPDE